MHTQRPFQRQGITRAAAVTLGRNHGDGVGFRKGPGHGSQSGGEIAIIIAQQDMHVKLKLLITTG